MACTLTVYRLAMQVYRVRGWLLVTRQLANILDALHDCYDRQPKLPPYWKRAHYPSLFCIRTRALTQADYLDLRHVYGHNESAEKDRETRYTIITLSDNLCSSTSHIVITSICLTALTARGPRCAFASSQALFRRLTTHPAHSMPMSNR